MSTKPLHCDHAGAYLNVISHSLKFWVCPKCKKELDGPPPKYPSQKNLEYPEEHPTKKSKKFPEKVTKQYISGGISADEYDGFYDNYFPYYSGDTDSEGEDEDEDEGEQLWVDGTF